MDDDGDGEVDGVEAGGEEIGVQWQGDGNKMANGDSAEVLWRADDYDTMIGGDGDGEVLWRANDYDTSGEDCGEVLWRADDFDAGSECGDNIIGFGDGHEIIGRTGPTATYVQYDWSGTSLRSTVSVHLFVSNLIRLALKNVSFIFRLFGRGWCSFR